MKKVILTKFESTKDGPMWVCQINGCGYLSSMITGAIFHHHQTHHLPMENIKFDGVDTLVWEE